MSDPDHGPATRQYGFLLLPQFTLLAFSASVDPLRMANHLSGRELYRWRTVSADGMPVTSSSGIPISADRAMDDDFRADVLFVCGGTDVHRSFGPRVLTWLRKLASRKVSNRRLRRELGVRLLYPSFREGLPAALREEGSIA